MSHSTGKWNNPPWNHKKKGANQEGPGGSSSCVYWPGAWTNETPDRRKDSQDQFVFPKYADMEPTCEAGSSALSVQSLAGLGLAEQETTGETDFF